MVAVLLIIALFCALQVVRATHLIATVLWLAAVSACVAMMLYSIGAWEIAVIELSVGTGLVTVLMVFAITLVGDEYIPSVPQPLMFIFVQVLISLILLMTLPFIHALPMVAPAQTLGELMWQVRKLDMALQIILIFAGILGVLGLLGVSKNTKPISKTSRKMGETEVI